MMPGVARVRDEHDFERIWREDGAGLWRTIYAFTGGRRDIADDSVAEAFARAIAHAPGIRDPLAWLYRTAFRLAAEELRRDRRRGEHRDESVDGPEIGELMAALRKLSENQRAALVLRFEADLPIEEVARRMGIAQPTVRVHLHRGRNRLRELLRDDDDG
jgi:RNA polymerase sigma-70 factor (ECF subfamily)